MNTKILCSLAILLIGASTGISELSKQDLYDYWNFNEGVNGSWKNPNYTSGMDPSLSIGNHPTSMWDKNYGYGYEHNKFDSGNGSLFASFKEGGDITLKYGENSKPTWKGEDGMSLSMLICNGNTGATYSSSHGFYFETNLSDSVTGATSNFYFAFVPEADGTNMKFLTNMPGNWDKEGLVMPLPDQDKLLSFVITFKEGALVMYLEGQELLRCDGWGGEDFSFDTLDSLQIGGPPPSDSEFSGLTGDQQRGSFVVDELAVWNKALNKDEIDSLGKDEIDSFPMTPSVPEPSSAVLACLGLAGFVLRRRRA